MKQQAIERIRALLEDRPEPQLLFEGDTLAAINACARGLLPEHQIGDRADDIFGEAVLAFHSFSGADSVLFFAELGGAPVEVQLSTYQKKYVLAKLSPTQETIYAGTMRAVAESISAPLAAIQAAKSKLQPLFEEAEDPVIRDWAARMNQGLYSMMRVVGNLRLLGDPKALQDTYKVRTNVTQWLKDLVDRLRPLLEDAQRKLVTELPRQDIFCEINAELLRRAILNVVSNSVKYTEPGGSIEFRAEKKDSGYLQITIRDDGPGISGGAIKTMPQIMDFRPQLRDGRTGMGVGLYMAKKIMVDHGGDLFLVLKPDAGATVCLMLGPGHSRNLEVHFRSKMVDSYSGYDPFLQELADVLPSTVFDPRGVD
jgi:signal transduction histidine kinase